MMLSSCSPLLLYGVVLTHSDTSCAKTFSIRTLPVDLQHEVVEEHLRMGTRDVPHQSKSGIEVAASPPDALRKPEAPRNDAEALKRATAGAAILKRPPMCLNDQTGGTISAGTCHGRRRAPTY